MLRIRLDLENWSTIIPQMNSQTTAENQGLRNEVLDRLALYQDGVKTSLHQVYEQVDGRIAKVEEMLKAQGDQVQSGQLIQFGSLYGTRPINRRRSSPETAVRLQALQPAHSEGISIRLNQYTSTCQFDCRCACHTSKTSSTPAIIDRVLGQLFVGYAGIPFFSAKCDVRECQKSPVPHVNLEYWFPLGFFWSHIVRLQMGYQPHLGPQVSLSTLRRIPDSAQCVNFALNGNIDGLKTLFRRGLASPQDVSSTRGYSILRVSP